MNRSLYFIVPLLIFCCGIIHSSWATKVLPLNLESITKSAAFIFEGKCIDVKTGRDPETGYLATWYTFQVLDGLKGDLDETHTFKQFGGSDGELSSLIPNAKFEKGEHLVLFLYEESELGFTSAVGMHQGKFVVRKLKNGNQYVSNGMPGMVLFQSMEKNIPMVDSKGFTVKESSQTRSERMELNSFLNFVGSLVKEKNQPVKK